MIEIPGYTVLRLLGQGGMATVYLALQQSLRREVALKILSPSLAQDPIATERFLREARVSAKLHHPHIVAIYDVGVHEGVPYMSIAYEPGGTVAAKGHAREDPKVVLHVIRDIASALDYAHRQGVIHRDVKPENILLRNDGTCVLSDFGIAHAVEAQTGLTREGTSVGTPHYMSPEQLRGEHVDGRTDLYSLGVVCYQLLTGELPYQGTDGWAIGIQHLSSPIPHLPGHLAHLQTFLDALLAKDPSRRLQTGAEVVQWIDARLSGQTPAMTVAMPTPAGATTPPGGRMSAASLAILPFADMSQGKDQEYLADGLSEELLNLLSKVPGLFVASRSSAASFKGKSARLAEIGRELKVATVLEGSVRKFGERVRISVQLINVEDGFQRWSETYDRQLTDVFAVQDEIAALVLTALKEQLLPGREAEAKAKGEREAAELAAAAVREREAAELQEREAAERAQRELREREEAERAAEEQRQRAAAEQAATETRKHEEAERAAAEARKRDEAERTAAEARKREEAELAAAQARNREEAERAAAEARKREEAELAAAQDRKHAEAERVAADARRREEAELARAQAHKREEAERAAAEARTREEVERAAAEARKREEAERAAAEARQREAAPLAAAQARPQDDAVPPVPAAAATIVTRAVAAAETTDDASRDPASEFASAYMAKPKGSAEPSSPGKSPPPAAPLFTPMRGVIAASVVILGLIGWMLSGYLAQRDQVQCQALLLKSQTAADIGDFDKAATAALEADGACHGESLAILQTLEVRIQEGKTVMRKCQLAETRANDLLGRGLPAEARAALEQVKAACGARPGFVALDAQPGAAVSQARTLVSRATSLFQANAVVEAEALVDQALKLDANSVEARALQNKLALKTGKPLAAPVAPVAPPPQAPAPMPPTATAPVDPRAAEKAAAERAERLATEKARRAELQALAAAEQDKSRKTPMPAVATPAASAATEAAAPAPAPQAEAPAARSEPTRSELVAMSTPQPPYPPQALRGKISGEVTVSFVINADGSVSGVRVVSAKPRGVFDRGVLQAVGRWKFRPIDQSQTMTRTFTFQP